MASDSVVRVRINQRIKDEAARVLADMGLSMSDVVRLLFVRVAAEKALPFDVKAPKVKPRP